MAIHDKKKAQTIRNLWATRVARKVIDANTVVSAIRVAITSAGIGGEFSTAEKNAMQAVETSLAALAALPGITSAQDTYRPHHVNEQNTVGLDIGDA